MLIHMMVVVISTITAVMRLLVSLFVRVMVLFGAATWKPTGTVADPLINPQPQKMVVVVWRW